MLCVWDYKLLYVRYLNLWYVFVISYQGEGSLTAKQQWLIEIRGFRLNIAMVE